MVAKRVIMGTMAGALALAGLFAMPALGAPDTAKRAAAASTSRAFFTPAAADPRLAALVARNGLGKAPFRFTPVDSRGLGRRAIDAVLSSRTPTAREVTLRGDANANPVGLAPIAYNLVSTATIKKLNIPGDAPKIDLGTSPSGRRMDFSIAGRRPSKLKAVTDRPTTNDPRLTNDGMAMINVGGAYSLRRNIDVTAGVRYKAEDRDQLAPLPDNRRESQAVYVGTTFKF